LSIWKGSDMKKVKMLVMFGGFTIVEMLVALAITSMLMVAVGFAFKAASMNYRVNEDIFKATNSARQALIRITTQIRTAEAADPDSPNNECTLITAEREDITYRYDNEDKKLYLITNDDLTDPDYVLCDNVTAMTFEKVTLLEDSPVKVRSFNVSMTVKRGGAKKTFSAAAVIRRNLRR